MAAGFPLTGVDPSDPIPGIQREIRFAQGDAIGTGNSRSVLLFGNKTSGGSETENTLGDPINGLQDCINRFGQRSEVTLMYRNYNRVDPEATIHAIAIPENGSAAAATCTLTFVNAATATGTVELSWGGETVSVSIENGDAIATIAAAVSAKINEQTHWPFTASPSSGVVTITAANGGVRPTQYLNALRGRIVVPSGATITTTIAKSAVTAGTGADDNTSALAAAAYGDFFYHVGPYDLGASPSATDNGPGEHAAFITAQALPAVGKSLMLIMGSTTATHSQADTGASTMNNALVQVWPTPNNDWAACMVAAHMAAVTRVKQIANPAANLTDYGKSGADLFFVPRPYTKSDAGSTTQIRAHLNNGCSVIGWTDLGRGYVVRQVNSYCKLGSNYDYRCREGHIPSAIFAFWEAVASKYLAQKQPIVSEDPVNGETPKEGTTYPSDVRALVSQVMDDMVNFPGHPVLDPGVLAKMKQTINVVALANGISCRARPIAARHNLKGQFLLEESSQPY